MTAVALLRKDELLARLAAGEMLSAIAADLGVTAAAISQELASDQAYRSAREVGALIKLERREQEMEQVDSMLKLARTRELLSHQRWRCEREFPHRWGQQQTAPTRPQVAIQINLQRSNRCDEATVRSLSEDENEESKA